MALIFSMAIAFSMLDIPEGYLYLKNPRDP
jgi:hypothetical protein